MLIEGAPTFGLWDKSQYDWTMPATWQPASSTINPGPAPLNIALQWSFDSVDDLSNTGQGIYVDDIVATTPCSTPAGP